MDHVFENDNTKYHLGIVLEKMCNLVGTTMSEVDFTDDRWYMGHTFTEEQSEEFKKWFVNYLYKNTEAQIAIFNSGRHDTPKRELKNYVNSFYFNYGWSTETKEERRIRLKNERLEAIEEI